MKISKTSWKTELPKKGYKPKVGLYTKGFLCIVMLLFIIRLIFPEVTGNIKEKVGEALEETVGLYSDAGFNKRTPTQFYNLKDSSLIHNKIYSVSSYRNAFPDENDTQLVSARQHGVGISANIASAQRASDSLVYVGANPLYDIDKLDNSVPYLVPRASALLQDIAQNFCDSLLIKNIPLHKIIVTSVLRTQEDVERLQRRNSNATTNSCHLHGTTFDICYNRYNAVDAERQTRNDSLKWVLSEVLNDLRNNDRCFVKYEIRQGCFHITTK